MAQLVAHHTGSVGVTGSNPVSSTEHRALVGNDQGSVMYVGHCES